MNKPVISCEKLKKTFKDAGRSVTVFNNINLCIDEGDSIAIVGRSGSGKSTLLQLLGGLDNPSAGKVMLANELYSKLSEKRKSQLRNQYLGFVYQFHHLLPEFTALENVMIPLMFSEIKIEQAKQRATELLKKVGLSRRLEHKVAQLSGGERQRVAIARALVTHPKCLLADEPTGNLDAQTAADVFKLLLNLNQEFGTSLVIVTHDQSLAKQMKTIYTLEEGELKNA